MVVGVSHDALWCCGCRKPSVNLVGSNTDIGNTGRTTAWPVVCNSAGINGLKYFTPRQYQKVSEETVATTIAQTGFSNWPTYGRALKQVPLSKWISVVPMGRCRYFLHYNFIPCLLSLSVGGRKSRLDPQQLSPSWAELLASHLHSKRAQHKPCTSKPFLHIKPSIDERAGISSAAFMFSTVSLYICCQILNRGEKHFPVFIWRPLGGASSHDRRSISSHCPAREANRKWMLMRSKAALMQSKKMSAADGGLSKGRAAGETGQRGAKQQTLTTQMQILGAAKLHKTALIRHECDERDRFAISATINPDLSAACVPFCSYNECIWPHL